jgi:histone deacetylase 11
LGWAVNLSGGFHHATKNFGGGFCIYPDITLIVHYLRSRLNKKRIMIVDLDAHQGNGY